MGLGFFTCKMGEEYTGYPTYREAVKILGDSKIYDDAWYSMGGYKNVYNHYKL